MRNFLPFPAFVAACLLLAGCSGNRPSPGSFSETAFQSGKNVSAEKGRETLTLRLAVNDTYCKKTACSCIENLAAREYGEVLAKLRQDYNIDLTLTYCMEEEKLEGMLKSGKFDGAICKPWFAFRLMPAGNFRFTRVADVLDPFDNGLLGGMFIVKKESPVTKPEDIAGKILAMGKEDSYEKYHLAMAMMDSAAIKPARIIRKSVCSEGINLLLDNQAEVAVISDYALIASCAVDFAKEDAFRTIWKTADIPLCSVILDLNRVGKKDVARLQAALLAIAGKECPGSFASNGFVKPIPWTPKPYKGISD
jgi:hypothetical protein